MSKYAIIPEDTTYLMHHGIKGQKWGVRRFQNADGSLKPAGAKRYGYETSEALKPSRAERKAAKQEAKRASINDYKKILYDQKKADEEAAKIFEEGKKAYKDMAPTKLGRVKEAIKEGTKGTGNEAAKKYYELYDKATKISDDAFDRKAEAYLKTKSSIRKAAEKEFGKEVKAAKKEAKKEEKAAKKEAKIKDTKDAVKAYQKAWNKSIKDTDAADDYYRETVKPLYNSLAKTKLGRVREVIKAQRGKGSKAANEYLKAMDKAINDRNKADEQWKEVESLYKKTGKNKVSRVVNNAKYDTGR